jgi:hypothetical protein
MKLANTICRQNKMRWPWASMTGFWGPTAGKFWGCKKCPTLEGKTSTTGSIVDYRDVAVQIYVRIKRAKIVICLILVHNLRTSRGCIVCQYWTLLQYFVPNFYKNSTYNFWNQSIQSMPARFPVYEHSSSLLPMSVQIIIFLWTMYVFLYIVLLLLY